MPSAFIDDGYTLTAKLSGESGVYDPFEITYRPLVRSEHFRYANAARQWFDGEDRIKRENLEDLDKLYAEILAGSNGWTRKLLDWTLTDHAGKKVEINQEHLLMLHPAAFDDLIRVFFPRDDSEGEAEKN